jgi:hypothetical protein
MPFSEVPITKPDGVSLSVLGAKEELIGEGTLEL